MFTGIIMGQGRIVGLEQRGPDFFLCVGCGRFSILVGCRVRFITGGLGWRVGYFRTFVLGIQFTQQAERVKVRYQRRIVGVLYIKRGQRVKNSCYFAVYTG